MSITRQRRAIYPKGTVTHIDQVYDSFNVCVLLQNCRMILLEVPNVHGNFASVVLPDPANTSKSSFGTKPFRIFLEVCTIIFPW
jgi:hypothetical protein